MPVGGRQLGERQTQQSIETPSLNDDDDDNDDGTNRPVWRGQPPSGAAVGWSGCCVCSLTPSRTSHCAGP